MHGCTRRRPGMKEESMTMSGWLPRCPETPLGTPAPGHSAPDDGEDGGRVGWPVSVSLAVAALAALLAGLLASCLPALCSFRMPNNRTGQRPPGRGVAAPEDLRNRWYRPRSGCPSSETKAVLLLSTKTWVEAASREREHVWGFDAWIDMPYVIWFRLVCWSWHSFGFFMVPLSRKLLCMSI
jgi:hypothetical protein